VVVNDHHDWLQNTPQVSSLTIARPTGCAMVSPSVVCFQALRYPRVKGVFRGKNYQNLQFREFGGFLRFWPAVLQPTTKSGQPGSNFAEGGLVMNFKFVAAASLAVFSIGSQADNLGPLVSSASFSKTVAAGSFIDIWSFDLATPSIVAASATNVEISFGGPSFGGIDNFAAWLNNVPLQWSLSQSTNKGITVSTQVLSGSTTLPAGTFQLTISGIADAGGASYGGNIVATPVPEPETLAMMLAGLGALAFVAGRRQNP